MAKGLDYGELGALAASGALCLPRGTPPYVADWDSILLAYANVIEEQGGSVDGLLVTWGTPREHWSWFNEAREQLRQMSQTSLSNPD